MLNRTKLRKGVLTAIAALAAGIVSVGADGSGLRWGRVAHAAASVAGTVSHLKGKATRTAADSKTPKTLRKGSAVYAGDKLATSAGARMEVKLNDGSMLRLGEHSRLSVARSEGPKGRRSGRRKVSMKLLVGRAWAAVTNLFGKDDSSFEVTTTNAVAGVRGTRFSASLDDQGVTTVKVYSGKVLVSNKPIYAVKGHTKDNRVQVAGPQLVSKKQWEEMVASAMQVIRVASSGEMDKPQAFALADPAKDDWEAWNAERDKLAGLAGER